MDATSKWFPAQVSLLQRHLSSLCTWLNLMEFITLRVSRYFEVKFVEDIIARLTTSDSAMLHDIS